MKNFTKMIWKTEGHVYFQFLSLNYKTLYISLCIYFQS